MSTLLQLWREITDRSPGSIEAGQSFLKVSGADVMLLGCEIERACTPPAPPSIVETLGAPDLNTVTFDASQYQLVPKVPTEGMIDAAREKARNWSDGFPDHEEGYTAMLTAAPTPAAQSAGKEAVAWPILKGIGRINGDGWKDTTKVGQIVYVWNAEKPAPYMAGQYPRIGNEGWSASTKQYDFTPATVEDIRDLFAANAAPVSGGTQGVWDVYAFGKWQRRVSAPVAWDAHAVYLDMVKNGWSKDIELRGVSSANYSAPVNGGERTIEVAIALEQQRTLAIIKAVRDQHFGTSNPDLPTQASAAFDLACEEIEHRLRTEQWTLGGVPAPLPDVDAPQVGKDAELMCRRLRNMGLGTCDEAADFIERLAALSSPAKVGEFNKATKDQIAAVLLHSHDRTPEQDAQLASHLAGGDPAKVGRDERDVVERMARAMNIATDGHDRYWAGYVKSAEAAYRAALASPAKVGEFNKATKDQIAAVLLHSHDRTPEQDAQLASHLAGGDPAKVGRDERDVVERMARAMNIATDGHDRYWAGYVKSAEAAYRAALASPAKVGGDELEAFEREASILSYRIAKDEDGDYLALDTAIAFNLFKALKARAALSADGGEIEARAKTVHRRIDSLCDAANTPEADYFDASTNMMIATRELLTAIGHPHAMDVATIAAKRAKGDA